MNISIERPGPVLEARSVKRNSPEFLLAVALLAGVILSLGCTVVGRGRHVLLRALCPTNVQPDESCSFLQAELPLLVTASSSDQQRVLVWNARRPAARLEPSESRALTDYRKHLRRVYGDENYSPLSLSAMVRDRAKIPPYVQTHYCPVNDSLAGGN